MDIKRTLSFDRNAVRRARRMIGVTVAVAGLTAVAACGADSGGTESASDFPSRDLTVIAAGDPGGGLDTAARQLQAAMKEAGVSQQITVEDNGGGGGNPARAALLKRANDGYTVVAESDRIFLNPILGLTDMTMDDFTAIAQITNDYEVWAVKADSPYKTAEDVLEAAKSDPKSVSFGVGTVPSDDQFNILMAAKTYGIEDLKTVNIVAFQSGGDLNTELLGGHVDVVSTGLSETTSLVEAGKIRLLSISSEEPQEGVAEGVPTWGEIGLDFSVSHWRGIFGPADMPDYAVKWWQDKIEAATKTDEWAEAMKKTNLTSDYIPGDEWQKELDEQASTYKGLLQEVGLVD